MFHLTSDIDEQVMKNQLLALLEALSRIGSDHPELYDSEVREQIGDAIMESFVRAHSDFTIPNEFGMYTFGANQLVRAALAKYISDASAEARAAGIESFHDRLAAFQDTRRPIVYSGDGL